MESVRFRRINIGVRDPGKVGLSEVVTDPQQIKEILLREWDEISKFKPGEGRMMPDKVVLDSEGKVLTGDELKRHVRETLPDLAGVLPGVTPEEHFKTMPGVREIPRRRRGRRDLEGQLSLPFDEQDFQERRIVPDTSLDEDALRRLGMRVSGGVAGGAVFLAHPLLRADSVGYRKYQASIAANAAERNTLVVLPTGLGKTAIAAVTAARRLEECPDSKILVLAPTKPLVEQHAREFESMVEGKRVGVLTGRVSPDRRNAVWSESDIIVATPQTIRNELASGGLDLSSVSLLVVDEAHHATGRYSYVDITREYSSGAGKAKNPLVLGLTASPSSKIDRNREICDHLQVRYSDVEVRTREDPDVVPYFQFVEKTVITVKPPDVGEMKRELQSMYTDDLRQLKRDGYLRGIEPDRVRTRDLLEVGSQIDAAIAERRSLDLGYDEKLTEYIEHKSTHASAMKLGHAIATIETHGVDKLESYLRQLRRDGSKASERIFEDARMRHVLELIGEFKSSDAVFPKLDQLEDIVREHRGKKVIVFTEYRDSVDSIVGRLNGLGEEGISARRFVGQGRKGEERGMTQREQREVLDQFAGGEFNVLVATRIGEEGLDMPDVDAIVFFEPVPDEKRKIQREGRTGRQTPGKVYVLIAGGTRDEWSYYTSLRREAQMKRNIETLKRYAEATT